MRILAELGGVGRGKLPFSLQKLRHSVSTAPWEVLRQWLA